MRPRLFSPLLPVVCAHVLAVALNSFSLSLSFRLFRSFFLFCFHAAYLSFSLLRWQPWKSTTAILFLSRLCNVHTHFLSLPRARVFLIIESQETASDWLRTWRNAYTRSCLAAASSFARGTQLYLICESRARAISVRFIEPLTLMDSSGHFIHSRFIRGILNR